MLRCIRTLWILSFFILSADDMGLGKTLTMIALVMKQKETRFGLEEAKKDDTEKSGDGEQMKTEAALESNDEASGMYLFSMKGL